MNIFKKKKKTSMNKQERIMLLYLLLRDIEEDSNSVTLGSRIECIKTVLQQLDINDAVNLNKSELSTEFLEELFYRLDNPSKILTQQEYKRLRKLWEKLD